MRTLTRKDMYDKYDNCILPKGDFKRFRNLSKYSPKKEDEKHRGKICIIQKKELGKT
jgi:hypothetical protein